VWGVLWGGWGGGWGRVAAPPTPPPPNPQPPIPNPHIYLKQIQNLKKNKKTF